MDKLSPIIEKNKIINSNEIISFIKRINDEELIIDYLNEIKEYNNDSFNVLEGLDKIKDTLISRLNKIKVTEIKEELPISENEFKRILYILYNGKKISEETSKDLLAFVDILLSEMNKGNLDKDKQNMLDYFICYFKDKLENIGLSNKESIIINKYNDIIAEKQANLEKAYREENIRIKKLKFKEKQESTRGAIVTVAVLEVTILLGILISVLALANN